MANGTPATAEVSNGNLVITIPLNAPRPSSTGKSRIVASTGGFCGTDAQVEGKKVNVSVNATIGLDK